MKTSTELLACDILCVGHASIDLIYRVSRHPAADEKMFAEAFICCGGGPAANAAVTAARLKSSAAFIGYAGYDSFGEQILNEFTNEGVNTKFVHRGSGATPLSIILVKPNGDRSVVNYNKEVIPLQEHNLEPRWLHELTPRVVLFDGHEPDISPAIAGQAKQQKIITILDAGSVRPATVRLAALVDYLVCSERFALDYTQTSDAKQALPQLLQVNNQVVITLGKKGLLWARGSASGSLAAFPVNAIDTTGAGDIFHGAFAFCLAQNYNWLDTLRFSSAAAALCCTKTGARSGIPTFKQVSAFLAANPLSSK